MRMLLRAHGAVDVEVTGAVGVEVTGSVDVEVTGNVSVEVTRGQEKLSLSLSPVIDV